MQYKTIILILLCAMIAPTVMAQTDTPDSTKTQELNEVVVEGQLQRTSATNSLTTILSRCR